jgi:hypothetical protein
MLGFDYRIERENITPLQLAQLIINDEAQTSLATPECSDLLSVLSLTAILRR